MFREPARGGAPETGSDRTRRRTTEPGVKPRRPYNAKGADMPMHMPHQTKLGLRAVLGLLIAFTLSGVFAMASQAHTGDPSPRHGALHATKECSEDTGQAGGFCTITGSNLRQIGSGSKVFYLEAEGAAGLDSDLVLYTGPGNAALGHVTLSFESYSGWVTLTGGTGRFRDFHARVRVTYDQAADLWHWDGWYRFGGRQRS